MYPNRSPVLTPDLVGILIGEGVFILLLIALTIFVNWKIAVKAGYSGASSLLMLIPLVNFVVLLIFAFTEWPIEKELKLARAGATPAGSWQPPAQV